VRTGLHGGTGELLWSVLLAAAAGLICGLAYCWIRRMSNRADQSVLSTAVQVLQLRILDLDDFRAFYPFS
jgi:predicted membrane metal-binding protein